jgi:hypothetical protein
VVVVVAIGGLARAHLLPSRGPLWPGAYQPNGTTVGWKEAKVGRAVSYTALWISNPSRVNVTLDSIEPIDPQPQIRVVGAWIPRDTPRCQAAAMRTDIREAPASCKLPIDGYVVPSDTPVGQGPRLVVELEADQAGRYTSGGFAIKYHVGPIRYTSLYSNGYVIHARSA